MAVSPFGTSTTLPIDPTRSPSESLGQRKIDPQTGLPYPNGDVAVSAPSSAPTGPWPTQRLPKLPSWTLPAPQVDYSKNYYGVSADEKRPIERIGTPNPLDPNAFQVSGFQSAQDKYAAAQQAAAQGADRSGALADRGRAMADQSRNLALQALTAPGPSQGELQLRAGQEAAMRGALAMARSGRGYGSAGQMQQAQFQGQEAMGLANQQAAQLRAAEEAQRRQQLLALGGMDLQRVGMDLGQQLGLGQQGLAALQGGGMQALAQQQALADMAKTNAGMQLDVNKQNAQFANYDQPAQNNTWSDVANTTGAIGGGLAGLAALFALSDERSKTKIQDLEAQNAALREAANPAAADAGTAAGRFATLPSYSYEYKDPAAPGAAPGTQVGPMAQDIERVLPGAVQDTPQGKMVDTARLTMANASATSELARRLAALESGRRFEDMGTLAPMQVDVPTRQFQNLGTLPPMQVTVPRRRQDLGALAPMVVEVPR